MTPSKLPQVVPKSCWKSRTLDLLMNYFVASSILVLTLSSLAAAQNDPPIDARWTDLCRIASQRELTLTTTSGESVEGYCIAIDINRVTIRSNANAVIGVARSTLAKLEVKKRREHHLRSLGHGMHQALKWGVRNALTPAGPVAIPIIPVTLAWGAAAAPFCVIGDLLSIGTKKREIRIIPDPPALPRPL